MYLELADLELADLQVIDLRETWFETLESIGQYQTESKIATALDHENLVIDLLMDSIINDLE